MNKAEKIAVEKYPHGTFDGELEDSLRAACMCMVGYNEGKKDTIAKIREQIERWMPDNPESDEYIYGERVAFRSVLNLLKEMEEQK